MHYAVIFEENSKPHQIFCQHFSVKLTFSIILIHSCNFSTIPVHVALLFSIPSHQLLGCFVEYFIVTEMVCDNNFHFRQTTSNELEMEFFFIHVAGWLMSTDTKGWKLMFVEYIYLWPLVVCIHFNIDTQSLFYTQFICIAWKNTFYALYSLNGRLNQSSDQLHVFCFVWWMKSMEKTEKKLSNTKTLLKNRNEVFWKISAEPSNWAGSLGSKVVICSTPMN